MIEAEVHSQLLAFIKQQGLPFWPHHLTMGRLVARTLRLKKSALIQTGVSNKVIPYYLSYLTPALLGDWPVIIVTPENEQQQFLEQDIPQLQKWLNTNKTIITGQFIPSDFHGIILTTPQQWLSDLLQAQSYFPTGITTIIDQADYLEEWALEALTATFYPADWQELANSHPEYTNLIRNTKTQLTKVVFAHPINPYQCHLIDQPEQDILQPLLTTFTSLNSVSQSWENWSNPNYLKWVSLNREKDQFTLHLTPVELASHLQKLWLQQPLVIIGGFLDSQKLAPIYRQQLGIGELLCLKFSPSRETEQIQLYLAERLPFPNTAEFQPALINKISFILSHDISGFIVLLVQDTPLKAQVATAIASEFGSKVQVETTNITDNTILVTGSDFWQENQEKLPNPQLLVIATLPIPSLENPLVASKVGYYKRKHKDWFRHYLLPTSLREIQRSVISIRQTAGIVAILDNRVNHRSYGKQILRALEPYVRINYIEQLTINN